MSELKPCPWCGDPVTISDKYFNDLGCERCGKYCSIDYKTKAEAIAAWNTRPIEDELNQRIKEIEAWQKEAVKHLKKYKRKCDFLMEEIDILALIKQAEANEKG